MTTEQFILSGEELRKQFHLKKTPAAPTGILTAVDCVNIAIKRGETVGIAGESGCGKSTLGKILAGLINTDQGIVRYEGSAITELTPEARKAFRRKTQMIFQDPFSSLNPRMRAGDIIAEPLVISGTGTSATRRKAVETVMNTVGLSKEQYNRFPHEFSGGQRQRIGIARALISSPEIIIADEPVSSLDISIQAQIINLLLSMKNDFNLSLLIISHDLSVLRHICDRISIMYLGVMIENAPTEELFHHCRHPYTEALIAAIPKINREPGQTRIILNDDIPSPLNIPKGCRFHTRCRYAADICSKEVPPLEEKSGGHFAACHFSAAIFN